MYKNILPQPYTGRGKSTRTENKETLLARITELIVVGDDEDESPAKKHSDVLKVQVSETTKLPLESTENVSN